MFEPWLAYECMETLPTEIVGELFAQCVEYAPALSQVCRLWRDLAGRLRPARAWAASLARRDRWLASAEGSDGTRKPLWLAFLAAEGHQELLRAEAENWEDGRLAAQAVALSVLRRNITGHSFHDAGGEIALEYRGTGLDWALGWAASRGHSAIVREHAERPSQRMLNLGLAMGCAAKNGDTALVTFLKLRGVSSFGAAASCAAWGGHVDLARALLSYSLGHRASVCWTVYAAALEKAAWFAALGGAHAAAGRFLAHTGAAGNAAPGGEFHSGYKKDLVRLLARFGSDKIDWTVWPGGFWRRAADGAWEEIASGRSEAGLEDPGSVCGAARGGHAALCTRMIARRAQAFPGQLIVDGALDGALVEAVRGGSASTVRAILRCRPEYGLSGPLPEPVLGCMLIDAIHGGHLEIVEWFLRVLPPRVAGDEARQELDVRVIHDDPLSSEGPAVALGDIRRVAQLCEQALELYPAEAAGRRGCNHVDCMCLCGPTTRLVRAWLLAVWPEPADDI